MKLMVSLKCGINISKDIDDVPFIFLSQIDPIPNVSSLVRDAQDFVLGVA